MTPDQITASLAYAARIATALEALTVAVQTIAKTLQEGAERAALPPPSPPRQAQAPDARVSA